MKLLNIISFFYYQILINLLNFQLLCNYHTNSQILEYNYNNFPKHIVAMHMPCEESNMFATKCMCHIKCKDNKCRNAWNICKKYENTLGCKYILFRLVGQGKIATLKRKPTIEETER